MKKLYLFPDTNLFVQCKVLQEIDWSKWREYEEVSLLVTRPIQAEIDRQKGGGNSRLSARARTTSKLLREILLSEQKYFEVRSANPIVRIYLRQDLKRDETLADQLDYDERDDQLVGTAALFSKNNPSEKVLLLTHDTGPMATAGLVGVPYWPIPDAWLRPPEADESGKIIKALERELANFRKAEPKIDCRVTSDIDTLENVSIEIYAPISEKEIEWLKDEISAKLPMATDFSPKAPKVRQNDFAAALFGKEEFVPSSKEAIEAYRREHYPTWIANCAEYLRKLHLRLNSDICWPDATVWLENIGSRPAEDALVTFSAKGNFLIMPPQEVTENDEATPKDVIALPTPPSAPQGRWVKPRKPIGFIGIDDNIPQIQRLADLNRYMASPITSSSKRDPNSFYYRVKPSQPSDCFKLTCQQWRHKDGEEAFEMTLHVEAVPGVYTGVLEIKVQASNMTDSLIKTERVRITVTETSAFDAAKMLVSELIERTSERS